MVRPRKRESSSSLMPTTSRPPRRNTPSVGRSRHPSTFISVLFPEPDDPMIATYSPGMKIRSTPRSASTITDPSGLKYVLRMPRNSATGNSLADGGEV